MCKDGSGGHHLLDTTHVKERTKAVSKLFQSYHPYSHKLGQIQDVLVTEISHDGQYYVGHNKCYDQVLVPKQESFMGKKVRVQIVETGKHFMKGRPVEKSEMPDQPQPHQPQVPAPFKKGEVSGLAKSSQTMRSEGWWYWFGLLPLAVTLVYLVLLHMITDESGKSILS
ncbi:threonylcarbamoyladenosine tRNA methylthiotransferase-like [Plakobranchus ocellatus]|uniref:Threonylcarbamoyladenosine tRNA methylthiotransferase-like n=1 Tax=Plakobranchus ocellatus TaxID=259542 RepID=A0AAV3YYH6_9GAST|nr:threonylcarbamoyladenosine tRNA methylthiotransferase-like [Plakobranchus ocellatus]